MKDEQKNMLKEDLKKAVNIGATLMLTTLHAGLFIAGKVCLHLANAVQRKS